VIFIAIDPGKTVGTAMYDTELNVLTGQEVEFEDMGDWLNVQLATLVNQEVVVACERFTISSGTLRKTADAHWAIEGIGITKYLAHCYRRKLVLQLVGDAKGLSKDERLREVGWYIVGKGHATDAVRHVIYCMANEYKMYPPWTENHNISRPRIVDETDWLLEFRSGRARSKMTKDV
jgi:hypothetical protein